MFSLLPFDCLMTHLLAESMPGTFAVEELASEPPR